MAYEPRRTLLIALSALTVVFAAALFPAAGVGSHPSGSVSAPGESAAERTPTLTEPPEDLTSTASRDESTEEDTPIETPTESSPETPTEIAGGGDEGDGLLPALSLGEVLDPWQAHLLALALLLGLIALVLRSAEPGTPQVHLPIGTVALPFVVPEWVGALSTGLAWLSVGLVAFVPLSMSAPLLMAFEAMSFLGLLLALGVLLSAPVLLVLYCANPGSPHVDLPFGFTVTLPFVVPEWVGSLSTGVSRLTMGFVVSLSGSVTQLLDASGAALRAVVGGLAIALGEGLRGTTALLAALPSTLAAAFAGLLTLPGGLRSLSWSLPTLGGSIAGSTARPDADARETGPDPVETEAEEDPGPPTVRETWVAMVDLLPVSRSPSTTPREFARRAVDSGFPRRPVARVTRAFEDVVYGGYEPGRRATAAREALASLRDRLGSDRQARDRPGGDA